MANKNAGEHRAFEHGGKILMGGSGHNVLNVIGGTLDAVEGGRTVVAKVDRGKLQNGDAYLGNEQPSTLSLSLRLTSGSLAAAGEIRSIVKQTVSGGKAAPIPIVVQIPTTEDGSSGEEFNFNKCVLAPGGFHYRAGNGDEFDVLELNFMDMEAYFDITTY